MQWALPVGSVAGIRVRLGLFYLLFAVAQLVPAALNGSLPFMALGIGSLLLIVILHEFGHCIACRAAGGEADDILIWPLGGLASCHPPHTWRANFWTTAGGPLVNVVLAPILALGLLAGGVSAETLYKFNPLAPMDAQGIFSMGWGQRALWWMYYTNFVILAFNVLVPMFPMDGGRLVQALLWRKMGYRRSMAIATTLGLGIACVLGFLALFAQNFMILGVALFGGITCYNERLRQRHEAAIADAEGPSWLSAAAVEETAAAVEAEERAKARIAKEMAARKAAEAKRQAELDRILAKIKNTGMGSLSASEKRTLEAETNEKRRSG